MFCSGYASLTVLWLSFLASSQRSISSISSLISCCTALLDKPDSDDLWRSWHLAPALWCASSSQFAPVHFLQTTESISGLPPTAVVLSFWCFSSVIIGGFSTYGMAGAFSISKNFRFYVETFPKVHSQVQLWLQCKDTNRSMSIVVILRVVGTAIPPNVFYPDPFAFRTIAWYGRHEVFNLLTSTRKPFFQQAHWCSPVQQSHMDEDPPCPYPAIPIAVTISCSFCLSR